jgi:hypothetical protein
VSKTSRVLSAHEILVVPCPTCGADRKMPCKPTSGQRRIQAHRERQWAASDKRLCDEGNQRTRIEATSFSAGRTGSQGGWLMATLRRPGVAGLDSVLKVSGYCLRPHTLHWQLWNCGNNVPPVVGNPLAIIAPQFDMRPNPTTGGTTGAVG